MNNRDASASLKGYLYQRYCGINYLFDDMNIEYIIEEGYEDIDLINANKNRICIQFKYYTAKNESLTVNSGLYKTIMANYEKTDIDKIIYEAHNEMENIYADELFKVFAEKKYYNIGKYILALIYKSKNENKNGQEFNINDISDFKYYDKNANDIKKLLCKNDENIYNFFSNEDNCNNYFGKFELKKGRRYDDVQKNISNNIAIKYSNFIDSVDDKMKNNKINFIKYTILEIFSEKLFQNKSKERAIKYSDIFNQVNDIIESLSDISNIKYELLKCHCRFIANELNNNNLQKKNIGEHIIKTVKIDDLQSLHFYLCLLNNVIDIMSDENIFDIKTDIILYCLEHCKNKKNTAFKLIDYLSLVKKRNGKNFKVPCKKLIALIDETYDLNNFTFSKNK